MKRTAPTPGRKPRRKGAAATLQSVLDAVARTAARVCEAHDVLITRVEGDTFRLVAKYGRRRETRRIGDTFPLNTGFVGGRAVIDRKTIHVRDLAKTTAFRESRADARVTRARTLLATPLLKDGTAVGAIIIRRTRVRPFTARQIALLRTFADQAAIAIENARLSGELQDRNRQLTDALEQQTATGEILRVISSSPTDVQPMLDAIVQNAVRLCDSVFSAVFLFDGRQIEMAAQHGFTVAELEAERRQWPRPATRDTTTGQAILDRRIVHVRDAETDPGVPPSTREVARAVGYRSIISVPMLRGDECIGSVNAARAGSAFTEKQIALLETFADQAVVAIENVRLFMELESRNRDLTGALDRQTATSDILRAISQAQADVQPVFEAIADSAMRLFGAWSAGMWRYDGALISLAAVRGGLPGSLEPFLDQFQTPSRPIGDAPRDRAVLTRTVQHVVDVDTDPSWDPQFREYAKLRGFRSALAVPMLRGDDVVGVIAIAKIPVGGFSPAEIALLQTFADQAVIAIENARLLSELQARNADLSEALEQQTATGDILRVISSSPTDVQPVFDTIVRNAVQLCGARFGVLHRFDGERLHLAAHDVTAEVLEVLRRAYPMRPGRSQVSGRAILTRAVAEIRDVREDPEYQHDMAAAGDWRSLLAVPMLRADGSAIGTIVVQRSEPGSFASSHIEMLKTFADQAVIAIENVRLFKELEARTTQLTRSVDELTALGEVSRALSSTLDLETVLNTIVARASQLAGTDSVSVYEYDETTEQFHWRASANLEADVVAVARRTPIRKGQGAQGLMAVTHEPVQFPDIVTEDAYGGPLRDVLLRTGRRAVLAVPLLRDDRLVGGLTVAKKTSGAFALETVELLKTFATQSALAIQNARLFREIEDKGRQLEVASRHKSQFLANMSHELRTPLNAILGYTELIADNIYGEVPNRMREVLERVDKGGRHLLGLINDILDLSKIEAGQLTLTLGPYSMDGVAQTVATSVGALAAEKQLGFEVIVADDLPLGLGDERRLTQVLLNLVGNAIKFTDAGKVVVRVGVSDDAYVVSVTDTGPGIAEGDREKIFEEFQQADTTRAKAKGGTGLGLAISRRIVAMHGGRLWVESTLDQGSTFSFTVPVHVERQVTVSAARSAS